MALVILSKSWHLLRPTIPKERTWLRIFRDSWCVSKPNLTIKHFRRCLVTINIQPEVSLVDEKVRVSIYGLEPHEKVTLKLNVTNNTNLNFASTTHYLASKDGLVDLSQNAPINHPEYNNPDPMGIFWSMQPLPTSDERFWSLNVSNGLDCNFQVYKGHVSQSDIDENNANPITQDNSAKRLYMADGVKRLVVKKGA